MFKLGIINYNSTSTNTGNILNAPMTANSHDFSGHGYNGTDSTTITYSSQWGLYSNSPTSSVYNTLFPSWVTTSLNNSSFTISLWANISSYDSWSWYGCIFVNDSSSPDAHTWMWIHSWYLMLTHYAWWSPSIDLDYLADISVWEHFIAFSYNYSTWDYAWYVNSGTPNTGSASAWINLNQSWQFAVSRKWTQWTAAPSSNQIAGYVRWINVFSSVLTPTQVLAIYNAG